LVFRRQLFDDILTLQFGWEHFPRVSFHFQVRTETGVGLEKVESAKQVIGGVLEAGDRGCVKWDVKMNPPFRTRPGFSRSPARFTCEGVFQVTINNSAAIRAPDHYLVQIRIICESRQRGA